MEQIKIAIRYFLSDGKTHTIEEVKAEISRIIGGEVLPGEVDSIFGELHHDTIVSQRITDPNGNSTSWVKAI
jgi:hypothetical protein